ncbi:MAG: sensor histidine kinase [Oceanipulchritudo sp.]
MPILEFGLSRVTMRREVTGDLALSAEEAALLDNHSLLNLCNVLEMQLNLLADKVECPSLRDFSRYCLDLIMELPQGNLARHLPEMEIQCGRMQHQLKGLLGGHPEEVPVIHGLLETIAVGHARIREFKGDRLAWQGIPREAFPNTLRQFLRATEKVSGGRFRFIQAPAPKAADAYWIDFRIEGPEGAIHAPGILHDTIRDLAGNARKYSEPGSSILIDLESEPGGNLRLSVSDEGMGVPEEEMEKIVQFGYRGTNALDKRTMGGGFGLTKAYQLCRRFNGRFFIESEIGRGTRIEMTLLPPG